MTTNNDKFQKIEKPSKRSSFKGFHGGDAGIRTLVPVKANGFQDRLVMTTSIHLRVIKLFVPLTTLLEKEGTSGGDISRLANIEKPQTLGIRAFKRNETYSLAYNFKTASL